MRENVHTTRSYYPVKTLGFAWLATVCGMCVLADARGESWPPAPALEAVIAVDNSAPLPGSISAVPREKALWSCTFRYRAKPDAKRVVLTGSFNAWDRDANVMDGPDANGEWTSHMVLETGVYQYKFLVDNEEWCSDPANSDRVPDGHGGFNSFVRLGRLAQLEVSPAERGDGKIDVAGLMHQPPQALYVQPVGGDDVSIRYRTLSHDLEQVWLAQRDGSLQEMAVVSAGPLFTYWAAVVTVNGNAARGGADVRGVDYTFVLDDGNGKVCDPYTYHYTFIPKRTIETPEWARHAVWYQIMVDRFRNGDAANDPEPTRAWTSEWFTPSEWEGKDGQTFYQNFVFDRFYGGDVAGLEAELPYLKELGVNALYLTPVFKAPSYHKYDVQNYIHIDDGFGTRGDYDKVAAQEDLLNPKTWQWTPSDERFLQFLKAAHAAGFKVIIDGVFNHVGVDHPAFSDVLKNGKRSRYADWFDVTSWEPFAYKAWAGFAHMPVFKKGRYGFASEAVKEHLFAVTKRWMDPNGDGDPSDGIDGWRLDVPNDIPRPFWAEWRTLVKETNPDALITGEVWQRADQWLDGKHFDAVMNYEFARTVVSWLFDRGQKIGASAAASRFKELQLAYPEAATYVLQNLVDSHDTDRIASMAFNPDREYDRQNRVQDNNPDYNNAKPTAEAYARARLAALLQMTYIGTPMIYYGDEAGMWGADDPSNRKPMLWEDLEPYAQPEENAVMDEQLAYYRKVIGLRNAHPALQTGTLETLLADDATDVWAFLRQDEREFVLVALNASYTTATVTVPLPEGVPATWTVLLDDGATVKATDGAVQLAVPATGGVVLHAAGE